MIITFIKDFICLRFIVVYEKAKSKTKKRTNVNKSLHHCL